MRTVKESFSACAKKLRYDTVVESTVVLIGFYLPCERTSLGPIIMKPISKDTHTLIQALL